MKKEPEGEDLKHGDKCSFCKSIPLGKNKIIKRNADDTVRICHGCVVLADLEQAKKENNTK